jgi:hypothetical protein
MVHPKKTHTTIFWVPTGSIMKTSAKTIAQAMRHAML